MAWISGGGIMRLVENARIDRIGLEKVKVGWMDGKGGKTNRAFRIISTIKRITRSQCVLRNRRRGCKCCGYGGAEGGIVGIVRAAELLG